MAPNPVNTALKVVSLPLRLTQKAIDGLRGGDTSEERPREQAAPPPPAPKDLDDATIARKVESALFRDRRIAKGKVDVNVADGVVYLHGVARTPELIKLAESRAQGVPEVRQVENLLHLPKTPAPTRTDTPARQRKAKRSPRSPNRRKVTRQVTEEEPAAEAEPTPGELSARGEGRRASPMGSSGGSGGEEGSS